MTLQSGTRVHRRGAHAAKHSIAVPDPLVVGSELLPGSRRALRIDPNQLPREYAMMCEGDCLEPQIADGSKLLFSTKAAYKESDFVAIWLLPEFVAPGALQAKVKRLALEIF